MRKAIVLMALVATWALAATGFAEVIVLKGGSRLELSKPYVVRGSQAILTLKDGTVLSVAASEIDRDATAAARAAATQKAAPPSPPAATSPAEAARAQQGASKAKVHLGDSDVGHDYAPTPDDAGGESAPAASDARIEVADWDKTPGDGSVTVHGNVRNSGGTTAQAVGLMVSIRDEDGKTTGSSTASLPSPTLEPGASMPFTASIAASGKVGSVRFQPRWDVPVPPKEKSGAKQGSPASPAAPASKPAPAPEPAKPQYVPTPGYAPPAPSATNQPDPEGHQGYLPGVEIPPPPPPPPPPG